MPTPKAMLWKAYRYVSFHVGPNAALLTLPDMTAFICPLGAEFELVEVAEVHEVLGTDGSAVTLDIKKATGVQAVGSGTTMLASTFNMKATVNTVVRKSATSGGLTLTRQNRIISAGQRIGLDFTGTLTALAGVHVDIVLKPTRRPQY